MTVEGWLPMRIRDFAWEVSEKSHGGEEVLSCTKHRGFVPSLEYFGKQVFSKETKTYKLVKRGQYAYATIHLDEGSIDCLSIRDEGIISPMYTVFDVDEGRVDRKFLLELLQTPLMLNRYAAIGQGSINRRKSISFDTLGLEVIQLPPLPEQKKIAAILSSVDEAIQATQAVIEQARRVKEGLLQDLLTRGIGHTRFKQTKIGEIPESWEVRRLDGILSDGPRNGMYKPADQIGSGSLIVGQTAFTHDRMVDFGATRRAEATEDEVATYGLQRGDILVTRVYATPEGCGRPAFVGSVPETAVYESNMMRLRPDPDMVEPYFVFSWLQKPLLRRYLMARASSSNQTSINQKTLGAVPIGVPSRLEQTRIVEAIRAAEITVWETEEELRATQSVKAGLLQDLLTGKVRVSV